MDPLSQEILRRHNAQQQPSAAAQSPGQAAPPPPESSSSQGHSGSQQATPMQWEAALPATSAQQASTPATTRHHEHEHQHPHAHAHHNPAGQQPFDPDELPLHPMFRQSPPQPQNGVHSPSPPAFDNPFNRPPANAHQRRPSKQVPQRTPGPPHQQSLPPHQPAHTPSAAGPGTSGAYHPDHAHQPQPNANPGAPRHQPHAHMNPQHQGRASTDWTDPGRVASPSGQAKHAVSPQHQPPISSYARRPSYAPGPPPNDPAYPMPVQRSSRPVNPTGTTDREPVTIFMEDYRASHDGEPEHLLAEVMISLRTSTTHDGYWANAQELVDQLQQGPSRIDGPAKVFCRRGKYKHCFLRMGEGHNDIECQPSSLQISPELSIQVMIENNKMPHAQHRSAPYHVPPRIGRMSPRSSVQHDAPHNLAHPLPRGDLAPGELHHHPYNANLSPQLRNAAHATVFDRRGSAPGAISSPPPHRKRSIPEGSPTAMAIDIDERPTKRPSITSLAQSGGYAPQPLPLPSTSAAAAAGYHAGKGAAPTQYGAQRPSTVGGGPPPQAGPSSYESHPSPPMGDNGRERTPTQSLSNPNSLNNLRESARDPPSPPGRGFDDGQWRAPRAQVNTAIANWLKPQIQKEDGYAEFMHSKGHVLTVPQLLRVYGFAQRQIQKWNNQRTPENAEGCPLKKIGKSNVLQALGRQTSWGSDCEQTLAFVDKYGPGGQRETERVVALVNGRVMPGEKEGSVYFLSVLRDVDREWRAVHETRVASGSANGGDATDDDHRRSSMESSSHGHSDQQHQVNPQLVH